MKLHDHLRENARDVRSFGPGVLARYLGLLSKDKVRAVDLRGVGRMSLRMRQSDMNCVRQVFRGREYDFSRVPEVEARIGRRYDRIVAEGRTPVILDGGANIGTASLWFAGRYPAARVVAVEPDAANFRLLEANARQRPNIVPLNAALGAEPGFVEVSGGGEGWAARTTRAERGVPVVDVAGAVRAAGDGPLFIAKIDIEGFERDLFTANLDWIGQAYAVIVEPHDWMLPGQFTSAPFMRALTAHPFELFIFGENLAFVRA